MLPATGRQHRGCIIPQPVTQSSAPEDGQNNCPKHVELTGIINKPLLLHLVLVYYTTSCNTQSSDPEDGQNNFPKHVELTGINNKPLLLYLVGCLYCFYFFF